MHIDDFAEFGRAELKIRVCVGDDAVGFMKGSGHAIYIDVAAQKNRLKMCHAAFLLGLLG